jgi:hypothetical protein
MSNRKCEVCAETGILSAQFVRDEETEDASVFVKPCKNHDNDALMRKNLTAVQYPIVIVDDAVEATLVQ